MLLVPPSVIIKSSSHPSPLILISGISASADSLASCRVALNICMGVALGVANLLICFFVVDA